MLDACARDEAIASKARDSIGIDKSKCGHTEIGFRCEACGMWFRCLHKCQGGRVRGEKRRWIARCRGSQELEELLAGSGGEAIRRMAHDVGVHVIGEVETDGKS